MPSLASTLGSAGPTPRSVLMHSTAPPTVFRIRQWVPMRSLRTHPASATLAVGDSALAFNTTGSYNTATGEMALTQQTGSNNTADGANALGDATGSNNTATGSFAMWGADSGFTSGNNSSTADGAFALYNFTTGSNNVADWFSSAL